MINSCRARIVENETLRGGFHLLRLDAPAVAERCDPGQFVMLRGLGPDWPYLRRPFSIYSSDGETEIEIVYKEVGRATSVMARTHEGEYDVLGPLGKGFAAPAQGSGRQGTCVLALAGGSGIPPVAFYCRRHLDSFDKAVLVVGARTSAELLVPVGLVAGGIEIRPYTDDGSKGVKGTVIDGLVKALGELLNPQVGGLQVVACGPKDMLARVSLACAAARLACEVSVEEVMACGLGACLACAVPRKGGGYFHACKDGPVFDAGAIDWERWLA